jgi:hypothetical protein
MQKIPRRQLNRTPLAKISNVVFEFAMSAEWFDNGGDRRHLASEETSAKDAQP